MFNSVVQVYFPERKRSYAYYNDQFELVSGDIVFVEGKLEGLRGRVESVSYNFKINLADYKRVIAKADLSLRGEFQRLDSFMATFDPAAAPFQQILTFFRAPTPENLQWAQGNDGKMFPLDTLEGLEMNRSVRDAGQEYYLDDKIAYLCIDHGQGRAIVEGSRPYVVEFTYQDGMIGNMNCECFCAGPCKHQYAAILQLREIVKHLEEFSSDSYCAVLTKQLFASILFSRRRGTLSIDTSPAIRL